MQSTTKCVTTSSVRHSNHVILKLRKGAIFKLTSQPRSGSPPIDSYTGRVRETHLPISRALVRCDWARLAQ
jgi:hypothetical protein